MIMLNAQRLTVDVCALLSFSHVRTRRYLWQRLSKVEGLDLYGPPANAEGDNRNPLVAFNSREVHANDLSFFLDQVSQSVTVERNRAILMGQERDHTRQVFTSRWSLN